VIGFNLTLSHHFKGSWHAQRATTYPAIALDTLNLVTTLGVPIQALAVLLFVCQRRVLAAPGARPATTPGGLDARMARPPRRPRTTLPPCHRSPAGGRCGRASIPTTRTDP